MVTWRRPCRDHLSRDSLTDRAAAVVQRLLELGGLGRAGPERFRIVLEVDRRPAGPSVSATVGLAGRSLSILRFAAAWSRHLIRIGIQAPPDHLTARAESGPRPARKRCAEVVAGGLRQIDGDGQCALTPVSQVIVMAWRVFGVHERAGPISFLTVF